MNSDKQHNITEAGAKGSPAIFSWFLTDWCNYKCSYCCVADSMVESYDKTTSNAKYKLILARLRLIPTPFVVYLLGGEPTLHPDINKILQGLDKIDNCVSVEFNTNLSRSLRFFESLYESKKVSIFASYHPEYYTSAFLEKADKLKHNNFNMHINVTDDPEDWTLLLELVDELKKRGIPHAFNRLYSVDNREMKYDEEYYRIWQPHFDNPKTIHLYKVTLDSENLMLSAMDIYKRGYDSYKGYKCQALMYNIDINGDIRNTCNGEKLPLVISEDHLYGMKECILESCNCDVMFDFYKEVSRRGR